MRRRANNSEDEFYKYSIGIVPIEDTNSGKKSRDGFIEKKQERVRGETYFIISAAEY